MMTSAVINKETRAVRLQKSNAFRKDSKESMFKDSKPWTRDLWRSTSVSWKPRDWFSLSDKNSTGTETTDT